MKIKIWGCRGSITAPGPDTLRYGGNTTCLEIRSTDGNIVVIDAGSGIRNFGKSLKNESAVSAMRIFFTHYHWDHTVGFPFFEPAYSDKYNITFFSGHHDGGLIEKHLSHQMEAPYFPVAFSNLNAHFISQHEYPNRGPGCCTLDSLQCAALPLNHPNGGYGFKFVEHGKTFIFLTDNELRFQHSGGLTRPQYVELCRGADLLLHDAQHTDEEYRRTRGFGHSTYRDATSLAIDAGVKRLGLFHHDPDRSDDELDRQSDLCREQIQQAGSPVECFACAEGDVIEVSVNS
jgi:phosphoribosyl 1,2-cyclic phosphodiesterase